MKIDGLKVMRHEAWYEVHVLHNDTQYGVERMLQGVWRTRMWYGPRLGWGESTTTTPYREALEHIASINGL